ADPEPNAGSHGSRSGNRGARRRPGAAGVWQQVAFAGALEPLEDRLLLSASFATPSYVLEGHASIASGSSHGGSPNVTPANSGPIAPAQMLQAYRVNQISFGGVAGKGAGQTIAIVDAYNDPDIIADAGTFNTQFGLQPFNVSGGPTLKVLNES